MISKKYGILLSFWFLTLAGCSSQQMGASLACAGKSDSLECSLARDTQFHFDMQSKIASICWDEPKSIKCKDTIKLLCKEKLDTKECRDAIAKYDVNIERDIKTSKEILAIVDPTYVALASQSQNKEWIALQGKGNNFFEIKNIVSSETQYWYPDEHKNSHIKAISNNGKLVAYLYGGINNKDINKKYTIFVQDSGQNEKKIKLELMYSPADVAISPKGNYLTIVNKTILKSSDNYELNIYKIDNKNQVINFLKKFPIDLNAKFSFSSDEERFFISQSNIRTFSIKNEIKEEVNKLKLVSRKNSYGSINDDQVMSAAFLANSKQLVLLLETLIVENVGYTTMDDRFSRNITLAIEQLGMV